MSASNLGKKFTCYNCGIKFYDLNRPQPICPKCRANQLEAPKRTTKGSAQKKTSTRRASLLPEIVEEEIPILDEVFEEEERLDDDYDL